MIACSEYHRVLQLRSQADIRSHSRKSERYDSIRPRVHESLTITDLLLNTLTKLLPPFVKRKSVAPLNVGNNRLDLKYSLHGDAIRAKTEI